MNPLLTLLLVLFLTVPPVHADSIATIPLHNRPAEEIIPLIKPMLGPDDAITGQGFQLFIRAPAATRAQVQKLVAAVDVAARMLLVSVFQGEQRELRSLRIEGELQSRVGDSSVKIGQHPKHSGNSDIEISTRNSRGAINVTSTRTRLQDNPIHQLWVSDGDEGYIETGTTIPWFSGSGRTASGRRVDSIEYKDVTTGFYVRPRVRGDQVTLQVSPFKQTPDPRRGGDIRIQNARTTITGRLGEWLPVGGTTEQAQQSGSRIGALGSTQSRNDAGIWIRADVDQDDRAR